jgi:CRP/FNR family nitrogen fixation transcriptional regulator
MQTLHAQTGSTLRASGQPSGRTIALAPDVELPAFIMAFARNEEVFTEEETADFVYKVISGAVRAVRILSDGRRQISAFHLPGDVFGLECGETHQHSVESIVDSEIALVRRSVVESAAQRDGAVARELWRATSGDLLRMQDHTMRLGRETAVERVASFLIELSVRAPGDGAVLLPMGRLDIADYLGLTIETVSRTLTQLERDRAISIPNTRSIVLHRALARAIS